MVFNLFILGLAALITYIWVIRGFFSALIHLVCTVIAGAVAFGVWEPLSYWILESAPQTGFAAMFAGMAWGIGLIVPFAVTLAVLRVGIDQLLPANVVLSQKFNYVGGGVCGLAAGVLTAGIVAIGLSFFRTTPSFGVSVKYGAQGNLERKPALLLPLDKATATFYGLLSERTFRTPEPLAKWHPDIHEEGGKLHLSAFEGKNRNTTRLADFEVIARYNVGEPGKAKLSSLLSDQWQPGSVQKVRDLSGKEFPEGSHIEGFVVNFKSGAKDKDGKTSVGSAQVALVLENDNDERMTVHPIAVSSQAASDKPQFARWWYNADQTFIASVGGGAEAVMGFEFPCPPGFRPIALYVKGARFEVDSKPTTQKAAVTFRSPGERDAAIATGFRTMGTGTGTVVADLDMSSAKKATRQKGPNVDATTEPVNMRVSEILPFVIQLGTHDQLEVDETDHRNVIVNGQVTLNVDAINNNRGIDRKLEIKRLQVASDQNVVQLEAFDGTEYSVLAPEFINQDGDAPPTLYDTNNVPYEPIGYHYQDETKLIVRYTPGTPIARMSDLPRMSKSRPAQRLTLIYRVGKGVKLKAYGVGKKITIEYDPTYTVDKNQGRL